MALSKAFTTLGELANLEVPEDREILDRLIEVIDQVYPDTWRDWNVVNYSKKDLFGSKIDPQVFNKLRFAIPTISIIKAFDLGTTSISEKAFKNLKLSLLDWAFCRALIISPKPLALKIHGSASNLEIFMAAIRDIKDSFVSREEAENLMTGGEKRKRPSYQSLQYDCHKRPKKTSSSKEINILKEQTKSLQNMVNQLLCQSSCNNSVNHNKRYEDDSLDMEEGLPLSETEEEKENDDRPFSAFHAPDMVLDLAGGNEDLFDFSPCVKEAEPKVLPASADLLEQAISCQRFGKQSWANLRYNEVNKKLQATPAFTSLSVNPQLAGKTPNWVPYEQVVKFDQTLGAVTHGLLLHWKQLKEALSKIATEVKSKALNEAIARHITGAETDFKKSSDDILQYVCGRGAELIEFRRLVYKPPSKFMQTILHAVPPSSTHLFEENALSETFKQNGGFYKFFPATKGSTDNSIKRQSYREPATSQNNRHQQFKKNKLQSTPSASSSANRVFRKHYEAKPNNRKTGGGHGKPSAAPRRQTTKPY